MSSHTNFAKAFGIESIAGAVVFTLLYAPLLAWFIYKSLTHRTHVHYMLAFFCQIRVVAFVIRAALAAPSYHSHNPQQQPYSTPPSQAIHSPPSTYPANFPHPQSYAQATAEPSAGADDGDDAYGGYVVESPTVRNNSVGHGHSQSGSMPNPFGRESSPEVEDRRSESEEEREEPRRVLKVANE